MRAAHQVTHIVIIVLLLRSGGGVHRRRSTGRRRCCRPRPSVARRGTQRVCICAGHQICAFNRIPRICEDCIHEITGTAAPMLPMRICSCMRSWCYRLSARLPRCSVVKDANRVGVSAVTMVCRRRMVNKGLLHVIHRHQRRLVRACRRRCSPMLQTCQSNRLPQQP